MRILLINQYAGSPSLGMEYRPHWMATEWIKAGHEVLVVAGDVSHLRLDAPPVGPSVLDGVDFLTLRTLPYSRNGARRYANMCTFRAQLYLGQNRLRAWRPDVVVASSTHPLDVRPAIDLARACDAVFVYEVHDLWPLTPMLLGGISARHPAIAYMQREENLGYRNADLVVSLLPGTEVYMREHGLGEGRWTWIPNGVEVGDTAEDPPDEHLARIGDMASSFPRLIMYAGTVGRANALEDLLSACRTVDSRRIGVAIVGDGPERERLRAESRAMPNILWLDPVRRSQVRQLLRLGHAGYAGAHAIPLYRYGISFNKIYDYMGAALPVIENVCSAASPTRSAESGWVTDPGDPNQLCFALQSLSDTPADELEIMGRRGNEFVKAHLTQDRLANRFLESLGQVNSHAR